MKNAKANHFFGFPFNEFGKELEQLLKQEPLQQFFGQDQAHQQPMLNVFETETGLLLELAAPGFQKEDFKLELEKDLLHISAKKNVKELPENVKVRRREFAFTTFERKLRLSNKYDLESITASYENGILQLEVPKKQEPKKEKISIQVQ